MVPTLCVYLVESIRAFPKQAEVKDMMRTAGHTPSIGVTVGTADGHHVLRPSIDAHHASHTDFPSAMSGDKG